MEVFACIAALVVLGLLVARQRPSAKVYFIDSAEWSKLLRARKGGRRWGARVKPVDQTGSGEH